MTGQLRATHCEHWEMSEDTVGGAGDDAAAACGMGIIDGSALVSLGTSGVVFAPTRQFLPCPNRGVHAFCHAVPKIWHQMGVILSAARCLDWFSTTTGRPIGELLVLLSEPPNQPSNVIFVPDLTGNRTPYNEPGPRASFTQLSSDTDLSDLLLAVLQGVAFALNDCFCALKDAGTYIEEAFVVGGGSQSRSWLEVITNDAGINLLVGAQGKYSAAFGADRLAAVASSNNHISSIMSQPKIETVVEPNKNSKNTYQVAYEQFTQRCHIERSKLADVNAPSR